MLHEDRVKIAGIFSEKKYTKIKSISENEDLKDYDFLILDVPDPKAFASQAQIIYVGDPLKFKDFSIAGVDHFFSPDVDEDTLINFCHKNQRANFKTLESQDPQDLDADLKILSNEIQELTEQNSENKKESLNTRGLSDYVLRLLSANTIEQLVYETESLRVLKYKGIKVSLIYLDGEGGFLCTRHMTRKLSDLDKIFKDGKILKDRSLLAQVLSRPVLGSFKIYSEDLERGEKLVALFESQNNFIEDDFFLNILKTLLFSNFVRVLQSEKLFKNSSLLSKAFSQIPNTTLLISPDYSIRVSNKQESIGKKCFQYMFSRTEPCQGCPIKDPDNAKEKFDFYGKGYLLEENEHVVYSSSVTSQAKIFYLHIYETLEKSQKRESIQIQRGKLKSIGLVTQALTHELNNPLTGMRELSLAMSEDFEGQTQEDLLEISKASQRCISIIESLKQFSSKKIQFERLNFSEVVKETLVLTKILTRTVSLKVELTEGLWISASRTLLIQSVFNILKNSVEALKSSGEIKITLTKKGSEGVLLIEDTGPGLPEGMDKLSLFGTKNKKKGTGFGLFLVSEFVKLHKGSLDFGNKKEGGAYFKLGLPLS